MEPLLSENGDYSSVRVSRRFSVGLLTAPGLGWGYESRSPALLAAATAWRREWTPSAAIRLAMWLRTVLGLNVN